MKLTRKQGVLTTEENIVRESEFSKLDGIIGNEECHLLMVYGLAGTGKSYFLQQLQSVCNKKPESLGNSDETLKQVQKNLAGRLCLYLDITDCNNEIEVYYKLALRIRAANVGRKEEKNAIKAFIIVYEWIYGVHAKYDMVTVDSDFDVKGKIVNVLEKLKELVIDNKGHIDDKILNAFEGVFERIPLVSFIPSLVKLGLEVKKQEQAIQLYEKIYEAFDSYETRRKILLKLLKDGFPKGGQQAIIILDNFQILASNELGRDHTWLTRKNGLISQFIASEDQSFTEPFWIIGSRKNKSDLFNSIWGNTEVVKTIKIGGFSKLEAKVYIDMKCLDGFKMQHEHLFGVKGTGKVTIPKDVVDSMLNASSFEDQPDIVLPYLLNYVTDYFIKLTQGSKQPEPIDFRTLKNNGDFFSYYFYMDLSDLMINAFQILSCRDTWNDTWLDLVHERFDNHLLYATNVLDKTAPIEYLGNREFKLHEALKEGLFNSGNNYIKKDVLKYLYDKYLELYINNDAAPLEKQKGLYKNIDLFLGFVYSIFAYVRLSDVDDSEKEKCLKDLSKGINRVHKYNSQRGQVSNEYCRLYQFYVDQQNESFHLRLPAIESCFAKDTTSDSTIDDKLKCIANWENKVDKYKKYLIDLKELANLYTNNNQSDVAYKIEDFGMKISEFLMGNENSKYYQLFIIRYLDFLNGMAYDYSSEKKYTEAQEHGHNGLVKAIAVLNEYFISLEMNSKYEVVKRAFLALDDQRLNEDQLDEIGKPGSITEYAEFFEKAENYQLIIGFYSEVFSRPTQKDEDLVKENSLLELFCKIYQKLRGNYGWYCYKEFDEKRNSSVNHGENEENKFTFPLSAYGILTYLFRKAMFDALKMIDPRVVSVKDLGNVIRIDNVLTSLHNVGTYLKAEADYLENDQKIEALNNAEHWLCLALIQREQKLAPFDYSRETDFQKNRRERLLDSAVVLRDKEEVYNSVDIMFAKIYNDSIIHSKVIFTTNLNVLESMEYLGDVYRMKGDYDASYQILERVLLERYAHFGLYDKRTLDSLEYLIRTIIDKNSGLSSKLELLGINDAVKSLSTAYFIEDINDRITKIKELL